MNITVVCDVLGKENNGSTVAANNLINYLRQRGHTVNVLCADESKAHEAGCYIVPQRNLLIFNKYVQANGVTLAKPDDAIIQSALCGADIVHVMFPFVLGITAAQIAKEMNLPVTAGFHMLAENVTVHIFTFILRKSKRKELAVWKRWRAELFPLFLIPKSAQQNRMR